MDGWVAVDIEEFSMLCGVVGWLAACRFYSGWKVRGNAKSCCRGRRCIALCLFVTGLA